ncbi:HNH endonuclease [Brevibacterium luteolum]|uniref:HNH endonuclease n=1 Tax=Brevibacterium luteolum TaxID=199591 RepID=A0A2N6PIH5_9MICO|nr:hypothetical protein [Brevibacterium luteolum]PMB98491.1 hypothetical protein CJ198_03885 [Brevibacterium luteolum]
MAWLRGGDTAPTHPVALAILGHPDADDRLLNELFGFVMRCAMASTAHNIEYRITRGTAVLMAGGHARAEKLLEYAVWAGYLTEVDGSAGTEFELIRDDEFIHLIPWDQREWAKQQKRDRNNWSIVIPVRLRDGDGCRYCGRVVQWENNKAALAGTYDHLHPGQTATIDTYVVACRGCNTRYGDMPYSEKKDDLLPPPIDPYFSEFTVTWMQGNRWVRDNDVTIPKPSRRRLSPGALAMAKKKTSVGSQPAKADGPRGHSTEHTPASASDAGPLGSGEDRPSSSDPAASDTPQPGPRDTTDRQSEQDPAGSTARPEGLSGIQPERDPASPTSSGPRDTTDRQSEQDPAEHRPSDRPQSADPAPLVRPSPGETPFGADNEQKSSRNCPSLPKTAPNVNHVVGQTRDGSGRDGPGLGQGRAGSGRVESGRAWAGTGRERASSSPDANVPRKRRRR